MSGNNPNSILNSRLPQPAIPFLDETGNVSRPWFYFLLSIYNRTGGTTPLPPVNYGPQIQAAITGALLAGIEAAPPSPASVAALAAMLVPPAPAPALSPFLPAYIIPSLL